MRVLQSFPTGRATTNPYLVQLADQLSPDPQVLGFNWRRALAERYDVFHAHWPEALLHGTTATRSFARRLLFRALLLRLWLHRNRTAVVRTVHNVRSHEAGSRAERALLARFDRRTTLWIRLNPTTDVPSDSPVRTIAHGDYRSWFQSVPFEPPVPGRVVYFGLIRPYKGVPDLIETFSALPAGPDGEPLSLRVVGRPTTADIGAEVLLAALADDRVSVSLGHASDIELARDVTQAELVALPYREMHNSGAAVLALSLGRPILVPSNPVTEALKAEVGRGWVFTYRGVLTAALLGGALERCRAEHPTGSPTRPDLSGRAWSVIAEQHREAYAAALSQVRGNAGPSGRVAEQPLVGGETSIDGRQIVEHSRLRTVRP
ncbi:glycosyl transferase [Cryobacterium sp. SO2]|uniref:glycosyl transferase n=1 Tax=Cryobacterium sp. SO2 TaxID=1897060 RepID=UPI00223D69F6|nr:glycosyl transferase [Cryobacterium sp. SO2]WEO79391.1 glycosyl transferase [Cryobacterium sp. SO2]